MKKVMLMAAFGALFASCKKEDEKCEIWTYYETAVAKGTPGCATGNQTDYIEKHTLCGTDLNGAAVGARVEYRSNDCYKFYREFVKKY